MAMLLVIVLGLVTGAALVSVFIEFVGLACMLVLRIFFWVADLFYGFSKETRTVILVVLGILMVIGWILP